MIRTGIYVAGAACVLLGSLKARYSYRSKRDRIPMEAEAAKIREQTSPQRIAALKDLLESEAFKSYTSQRIDLALKLFADNNVDYPISALDDIMPSIDWMKDL